MPEELKPGSLACMSCGKGRAALRGNCDPCYHRYRLSVRAGKTTWKDLESAGKVKTVKPKRLPKVIQIPADEANSILKGGE